MANQQGDDGFLGRWSRRKALVREGVAVPEPVRAAPVVAAEPVAPAALTEPEKNESNQPLARASHAQAAPEIEASTLSLDDVKALTTESDFKPFVARSVAPEVRNAAFKTLFADPHFNVMDGLDIYIDDYSNPVPMPASMLGQLASARFLKLLDDEEVTAPPAGTHGAAHNPAHPLHAETPAVAEPPNDTRQPGAAPDSTGAEAPSHAQDTDLRLQPDHAARREADRSEPE